MEVHMKYAALMLLSALFCTSPVFATQESETITEQQESSAGLVPTPVQASLLAEELTPEEQEYLAWAQNLWESLERRQGEIVLPNRVATLNVPENFLLSRSTGHGKSPG
jgi:hypothetical protein